MKRTQIMNYKLGYIATIILFALGCFFNSNMVKASETTVVASGYCGADVNGRNLTWELDSEGKLTISGVGEMGNMHVFRGVISDDVKEIEIESGVTSIGDDAFYRFDELTSVVIPDSLIKIGDNAFWLCRKLESVTISKDELSSEMKQEGAIGYRAFSDCRSLTYVEIMDNTTSIGTMAFAGCTSLESIVLPDSVINIGDNALGNIHFIYCSVDSIIAKDSSYKERCIPKDGLSGNAGENITYEFDAETNTVTFSGTGSLYSDFDFPFLYQVIKSVKYENYSGTDILSFSHSDGLISVEIPASVTAIPSFAFSNCTNLKNVKIMDGVTDIGESAFSDCCAIESIDIPGSVLTIGDSAFSGCTSLKNVHISDGVKCIEDRSFERCIGIKKIIFPQSVDSIGVGVFDDSGLNECYIYNYKDDIKLCALFLGNYNGFIYGYSNVKNQLVDLSYAGKVSFVELCNYGEHPIVVDEAVEPTETTPGLTEGSHCASCNYVFVAQKKIPALNSEPEPDKKQDNTQKPSGQYTSPEQKPQNVIVEPENTTAVASKPEKQTISTAKIKKYKAKNLKKKKATFLLKAKTSGDGKLTYKVTKYPKKCKKYISVSKTGKVTLKKGCKKGTYKITITAAKTAKYEAATKVITIKVK